MSEITTTKISKTTRQFIEELKVIPEETCDHVIVRALKSLKEHSRE
jgi:hypothetical protein